MWGWADEPSADADSAAELEKLGADVSRGGRDKVKVALITTKITDERLVHIKGVVKLQQFHFDDSHTNPIQLDWAKNLAQCVEGGAFACSL